MVKTDIFKILSSPETNMRDAERGISTHSIDEDMKSEKKVEPTSFRLTFLWRL